MELLFLFLVFFFFGRNKVEFDFFIALDQCLYEIGIPYVFYHDHHVFVFVIVEIDGQFIRSAEQPHRINIFDFVARTDQPELNGERFVGNDILRSDQHRNYDHRKENAHKVEQNIFHPIVHRGNIAFQKIGKLPSRKSDSRRAKRKQQDQQRKHQSRKAERERFAFQ